MQSSPTEESRLAFPGGRDTERGTEVDAARGAIRAYTAQIGKPPTRNGLRRPSPESAAYGAEHARLVRLSARSSCRSIAAMQCGAVHISQPGARTSTRHPSGRAVDRTMLVVARKEEDGNVWGDGSKIQGQRHRTLLPTDGSRIRT